MFAGMAVRMAIDLGLHLVRLRDSYAVADHQTPPSDSQISEEDRRLDRLTFWSVYFLDVSLSFGVGRETAFRLDSITQTIPTESDFAPTADQRGQSIPEAHSVRHAFVHAARLAFSYGQLVNVVNGSRASQSDWATAAQRITQSAVEVYNSLPSDMSWSALK
jgi:hypothetical protein